MTSVANIETASAKRGIRIARASFIRDLIDAEDRSVRYVANKIGLSPSTLSERLSGKNAFLADEIEALAPIVRKDAVELYAEYIAVGRDGKAPESPQSDSNRRPPLYKTAVLIDLTGERTRRARPSNRRDQRGPKGRAV